MLTFFPVATLARQRFAAMGASRILPVTPMAFTVDGRSYENGEPIRVTIEGRRIAAVDPFMPSGEVADLPWIAPGLFDLQINGIYGTWFSKEGLTADDVLKTLEPHFQFGVTRMLPTLVTNSHEALASGFAAIRAACEREPWANVRAARIR